MVSISGKSLKSEYRTNQDREDFKKAFLKDSTTNLLQYLGDGAAVFEVEDHQV